MNTQELDSTVRAMLAGDKGLLAMDESIPNCHKRFAALGIPQTEEMRRAYRDLIVTTPDLGDAISGAILFDETMRQKTKDGRLFIDILRKAGIVPGIKVDKGAQMLARFPGETVTDGLDDLRRRLADYYQEGARFAKWRAVITIGKGTPTHECYEVNAHALARYAALCQEASIVPIVEPEVLMDGTHTIEQCAEATEGVLVALFAELRKQRVVLEYTILKPNMVLSALNCPKQASVDEVADMSVEVYKQAVPAAIPGIVFLSGGQPAELASARLNAIHIGRWYAVIDSFGVRASGFWAFLIWAYVHITFLASTRSRFRTFIEWVWMILTNQRASQLIIPSKSTERLSDTVL